MHDEPTFRSSLDEHGILRDGAAPAVASAYAVFAQRPDARLDVVALRQHAQRFFGAKLGLTVDKHYVAPVTTDAARIVLATDDPATSGTRLCFGRPATAQDHDRAEDAERASRATGMGQLARRCPTLWLVAREDSAPPSTRDVNAHQVDKCSLLLAAIFASVLLGPILDGDEIFGVRTARLKLERLAVSPYR